MDKKQERAIYGPGWGEVILGVTLSLIVGVVLAAIWLISKPVVTAKEPSEVAAPGSVYYFPGSTNANAGRTWMRKKQLLVEGQAGDLVFTEQELNAWATASMKPNADAATDTLASAQVNFRINDGLLQIASPTTLNFPGFSVPVVIQARGDFRREGEHFAFVPREVFVGSLATHRIPGLAPKALRFLAQTQPLPTDVVEGWKKLSNVIVEGEHLHVTLP